MKPAAAALAGSADQPIRISLANQLRLTLSGALWLAFTLVLATYHAGDPGFSTTGTGEPVRNLLGATGAWLADVALVLLGYSVWWLVAVGLQRWLRMLAGALRGEAPAPHRRPRWQLLLGLALLLAASCALEWTRVYGAEARLPGHAGGVLGYVLGPPSQALLGFTGSGVLWIALLVVALPLTFDFSWLRWADALGAWVEGWRAHHAHERELAEDQRLGELARSERGLPKRRVEPSESPPPWPEDEPEADLLPPLAHLPIVIESPPPEAPPSARVAAERQAPLFTELATSRLPQVDLLDKPPARTETVSPESLEMTSRLIEKN